MSKVCEVTGKKVMSGHNVSHAKNRTPRVFLPNLHKISFLSVLLNKTVQLKISKKGISTIEKYGGIDKFLMKKTNSKLSLKLIKIKKELQRKSSPPSSSI